MKYLILKATVMVLLVPFAVSANPAHNIVTDSRGNAIRTSSGNCVRSSGVVDRDYCIQKSVRNTNHSISKTFFFDFDSKSLSNAEILSLNNFIKGVQETSQKIDGIKIEGYTDRLGTKAYNANLSNQRANSVRDHVLRIYPNIEVLGKGNGASHPNACKNIVGLKLKDCLYKDRKVTVTIDLSN